MVIELIFLAAAIHTPPSIPTDPQPPVWTMTATDVEGHPTVIEWFVCQPGDLPNYTYAAHGESFVFVPTSDGLWRIMMVVRYAHESAPGIRYVFAAKGAVHVGGLFFDDFEDGDLDLWH